MGKLKIKYYDYNSFIIESKDKKIAIDPGGCLYIPNLLKTNIPKPEWKDITHIIVTHGDPDHYWHTDRVQKKSNSKIICNESLVKKIDGKNLMLGPRNRGLAFTLPIDNFYTLRIGETIDVDGIEISGFRGSHGSLTFKIGPLSKTLSPGPEERIGWGEMVFLIKIDGKKIVNFGDTKILEKDWKKIKNVDILMIPIGGQPTMNVKDALIIVKNIKSKFVIPCHYNCPALFNKKSIADDKLFKEEVEKTGSECVILEYGESKEI